MKASGRLLREALECMTQCVLLPGVELNLEEVLVYYKRNLGQFGKRMITRSGRARV